MALWNMNRDKPKKKAAKRKSPRSGRAATRSRELKSRSGAAARASAKQEASGTPAKKAPAKKAAAKKISFKSAFADARKAQGAGGTFAWNGKKYTTDRADDKKKTSSPKRTNNPLHDRMKKRHGRVRGGK
tara:strand:- start:3139 stop:3528 length:390 start_codon:yes stop_codon:yes gene_type:complete